jgi:hypothetical protein
MREARVALRAVGVVAALLLIAPASADAQPTHLGTWTDLPQESEGAAAIVVDTGLGMTRHPHTYKLGAEYDYSINGSLLLSVTGLAAFAGEGIGVHVAPGVKYLLPFDGLAFIPYGRAALAVDLFGNNVAVNQDLGVGLKIGAGLQYWFDREFSVAPEFGLTTGVVSGDDGSQNASVIDLSIALGYRLP